MPTAVLQNAPKPQHARLPIRFETITVWGKLHHAGALLCRVALLCGGFFRKLHDLHPDKMVHHGSEVEGFSSKTQQSRSAGPCHEHAFTCPKSSPIQHMDGSASRESAKCLADMQCLCCF